MRVYNPKKKKSFKLLEREKSNYFISFFVILFFVGIIFVSAFYMSYKENKMIKDYLILSTSLGEEKNLSFDTFVDRDNYHQDLRQIACQIGNSYLYTQKNCDDLEKVYKHQYYSDNLVISYPDKDTIKITRQREKFFVDMVIVETILFLKQSDFESDGSTQTETNRFKYTFEIVLKDGKIKRVEGGDRHTYFWKREI